MPISPHVVRFSNIVGVCVRATFSICCLKWAGILPEYVEVVKGALHICLLITLHLYKTYICINLVPMFFTL